MYKICKVILASSMLIITSSSYAANGKGMTFGKSLHDNALGIDRVACTSSSGNCDAYVGDTLCSASRPILCTKVDGSTRPNYMPVSGGLFYDGWIKGHFATTMPVQGIALVNANSGDGICQATFGAGWKMTEFHDGGGGWALRGYSNIRDDQRYWVKISDQPANCWNP